MLEIPVIETLVSAVWLILIVVDPFALMITASLSTSLLPVRMIVPLTLPRTCSKTW